jgi:signal transduction histidine kinase
MIGRFERRIVLALVVIAVIPLGASVFFLDRIMHASESIGAGEAERRGEAIDRARAAYTELFAARKADLRRRASELVGSAPFEPERLRAFFTARLASDDDLKRVKVFPPEGDPWELATTRSFPDEEWRELHVPQSAGPVRFELTYVTARAPFREFEALDRLHSGEFGLGILHDRMGGIFRMIFFGALALVIAIATVLGIVLARRVTRRVLALSQATKRVAVGDLDAKVPVGGGDEIADLGRAFNEMVGELKVSRERIAYLQKIGAWQEIARRLAHEIKNPLTPIQLAVQQLRTTYVPRGEGDNYGKTLTTASEIVAEEIAGLRRLVEEFSAFAKLPRAELTAVDAGALVEDFLRSYSGFDGKVSYATPSDPVPVRADKLLLRRALHNLVENALQAGAKTVWIAVTQNGTDASITVADDGPGVPPDLRERLWDPYVTTKEHGTGLGLAIVKKIVLEHGGEIFLDEREGGGAKFTIRMPLG